MAAQAIHAIQHSLLVVASQDETQRQSHGSRFVCFECEQTSGAHTEDGLLAPCAYRYETRAREPSRVSDPLSKARPMRALAAQ